MIDPRLIALPRTWLMSANARYHWSTRARLTKQLRTLAHHWGQKQSIPKAYPVRVVITYHYPTRRRPSDSNNLAPTTKALVDGMTDAGLWPNDSTQFVEGQDSRIADWPTKDARGRIFADVSITSA